MLAVSIASAQQKAPTMADLTAKAVEANVITSDQKDKLLEINTKYNKQKEALKKDKSLSDDARKAENKRIDGERTKEMKALLGDKWADWQKFRTEAIKQQ